MARTQIRGGDQVFNSTILLNDLVSDFLAGSDWDITGGANDATITGLADGVNADDACTFGQLTNALAGLAAGLEYKGLFDAATPSPDLDAIDNAKGDFYKVSVAGTYLGIELAVGDMIIVNKVVAAGTTITSADIDKIDNTESADIVRTGDIVNDLVSTDTDKPLSAAQGKVLKDLIDGLDINSREYSESLAVTNGAATVSALSNTPVAGTVRVYLNGLRMLEGSGNDYTISGNAITFEYNLKAVAGNTDTVLVDYEY